MKTKNVFTDYALKIAFSISFMLFFSCESKELGTAEELEEKVKASSVLSADNIESGQKTYTFSQAAGGLRSYYISIPKNYSKDKKYKLLFVFAGTDSTGKSMYDWMGKGWNSNVSGLEKLMDNTIFVYPDQKYIWQDNEGEDIKGWALGDYAAPFNGKHDIEFTKELLELIQKNYSIDSNRIFATGHSWGGDMTNVTAYFLKGVFRAVAPVAANNPYWFENNGAFTHDSDYRANTAVWIFFGLKDDYFKDDSIDGDFGKQQADFWVYENGGNIDNYTSKPIGNKGDVTLTYPGTSQVKLTLYDYGQYSGGGSARGHQPPDYYFKAVTDWFNTF